MESRSFGKQAVLKFAGVLAVAGILSWQVGWLLPWPIYWGLALAAAAGLALLSAPPRNPHLPPRSDFLCDRCKYNHPDTCRRPERPNATRCPDFRSP